MKRKLKVDEARACLAAASHSLSLSVGGAQVREPRETTLAGAEVCAPVRESCERQRGAECSLPVRLG